MSRICNFCKKKGVSGHNVSYSKRRTQRRFKVNLRWIKIEGKRVKICMKCLKKRKNVEKASVRVSVSDKRQDIEKLEIKKLRDSKTEKKKTVRRKRVESD